MQEAPKVEKHYTDGSPHHNNAMTSAPKKIIQQLGFRLIYIHNKGSRIELCYQFLAMKLHSLAVMASFGGRFSV